MNIYIAAIALPSFIRHLPSPTQLSVLQVADGPSVSSAPLLALPGLTDHIHPRNLNTVITLPGQVAVKSNNAVLHHFQLLQLQDHLMSCF